MSDLPAPVLPVHGEPARTPLPSWIPPCVCMKLAAARQGEGLSAPGSLSGGPPLDPLRTLAGFLASCSQAACVQCQGHRDQVRGGLRSAHPLPQGLSSHLQLHVRRRAGLPPFCSPVALIPRHSLAEGLSCPRSTASEETWGPASGLGSFPLSIHLHDSCRCPGELRCLSSFKTVSPQKRPSLSSLLVSDQSCLPGVQGSLSRALVSLLSEPALPPAPLPAGAVQSGSPSFGLVPTVP